MFIDAGYEGSLKGCCQHARSAQEDPRLGGFWVNDTTNDPFLLSTLAVEATDSVKVGTNIAVAFARSPYCLAQTAYNLSQLSEGRFVLGLGSQIKAHIEKRFSMHWPSRPVAALKEYVALLRHLFHCFEQGRRPSFRGDYFQCTLNSPVFTPDQHQFGGPPLGFSAVGPMVTRAAGEVADAVFLHPFTHVEFLKSKTWPALQAGQERREPDLGKLEIVGSCFCLNTTHADFQTKRAEALGRLAFYASTPNYREVLASLGQESLHEELHKLSRQGRWAHMASALPPEFVAACLVEGDAQTVMETLHSRFEAYYDRVVIDPRVLDDRP